MSAKATKRLQTESEADETESVEGSSNDRKQRKYDKWRLEEQSTFFLKLPAMAGAPLQDCVTCIAHYLPNKTSEQVRDHFYRLKAQFQKHNPSRDLNTLTQKELFHAMTSMWAAWSIGQGQKPKLLPQNKSPATAAKMAKYILIMQESLEGVFKAREHKAELKAQRKADRIAGQQAQARAAKEAERLRSQEAEQRTEQQHVKQVKALKKSAGVNKENCSLASNQQIKAKKQSHRQLTAGGKPARRTHIGADMPVTAAQPAPMHRGTKAKKSSKAAAAASEAQDSAPPDSPELTELLQADSEPWLPEEDYLTHAEPSALAQTATTEVQHEQQMPELVHQQQAIGGSIHSVSCQQGSLALPAIQSQTADAIEPCQTGQQLPQQPAQQQQTVDDMSRVMSSAASGPLSKEPLCLRLRPLDSATRRLMQGFGCTALVEMPNNKPKKAVEGLLRHLQKKWEQAVRCLGTGYELHLVGLVSGKEDECVSWTSASVSSAVTLGQVQQQLQQSGNFLELCYVWVPEQAAPVAHSKAAISAAAAAGYPTTKQSGSGAESQGKQAPFQQATKSLHAARSLPFGSPLGTSSVRPSASSCSSARVLSEAFSNLHPEAPQTTAAAVSAGQQSHAGKRLVAAPAVDVTSSLSGLVTPCKHQDGVVHKSAPAQPDDTPGSSQPAPSPSRSDLAWEKANLPDQDEPAIEARLSQSHASDFQISAAAQATSDPHTAGRSADALPGQGSSRLALQQPSAWGYDHELSAQPGGVLSEQPSGYLTREASAWSIQPPGALSAEPSGWWDELPDAAAEQASLPCSLPHQTEQNQEVPQQLREPASTCFSGEQQHKMLECSSDLFDLPEDMDFELPALDSPEQAACQDANATDKQQSADADRLHLHTEGYALDAQLRQQEQEDGPNAVVPVHAPAEHSQHHFAKQGPLSTLLTSEEALLDDVSPYTQANEHCVPAPDQPAHGIPVIGTVVVGVPIDGKRRRRQPKQAKAKQPKNPKRGKAAVAEAAKEQAAAELAQQQPQEGEDPTQEPGDVANPQSATAAAVKPQKKAKAKYKKRKAESPPRLPPISPGALSLQEGIKRRRLAKEAEAKEAEAQAAATAASPADGSDWTQPEAQPSPACCADLEQSSQAAEEQAASLAPSASQPTSDSNWDADHQQQQAQQQHGSHHISTGDMDVSEAAAPASASPAGHAHDSQQSCELGPPAAMAERQTELTLSFDVAAMELFQQQDTCDAFGSFWRRTSGAGVKGKGPVETQAKEAVPAALRGGDISLGCWTATGKVESCKPAGKGPRGSPCKKLQNSVPDSPSQVTHQAQQAAEPAGSGEMDLTNYFATLPNEMVPFRDLISPLPVTALDTPQPAANQHSTDSQTEAEPLQPSEGSQCDAASPASRTGSGVSRQPTEQEIQHMDELDLTINFSSLLDPEDSWAVDNSESFAAVGHDQQAVHTGSADGSKPFQELFTTGN